jgi:chlorite dismutase
MSESCENCLFSTYSGIGYLACRRYPPQPVTAKEYLPDRYIIVWPLVKREDWCGEFKKSEESK